MSSAYSLPVPRVPIVGREKELADARRLLLRDDVCLLTLTGPGGIGKTRLALQLAADVREHFDQSYSVSLAPVGDPDLVLAVIAQAMNVEQAAGEVLLDRSAGVLRDKKSLLVLDSFEHVIPAAPLLSDLLSVAPGLTILVTSREALRVYGEFEFPVPPLSVPDPAHISSLDHLGDYDAVRLFATRAASVRRDFVLTSRNAPAVAEICARLDGLPLAIELAAARSRLLPPAALLARMQSRLQLLTGGAHDLPARQQTMRNTIAWSYALLESPEQTLFRRFSVFAGGFTIEAAQAVVSGHEPSLRSWVSDGGGMQTLATDHRTLTTLDVDILDGLDSLVRKSLLVQEETVTGEPRFMMLETIREYAQELLSESGEEESIRRSHIEYFLQLVEQAEPHLRGPEQVEWLDHLELEHANLSAALRWSAKTHPGAEAGLRLAAALDRFWQVRGHLGEGLGWLIEVLSGPEPLGPVGPTEARARALGVAGRLAFLQYDYPTAELYFQESLAMQRAIRDEQGIAHSLAGLGGLAHHQSRYAAARSLYEESLAIQQELGDDFGMAGSKANLAQIAFREGDYAAAKALFSEALGTFQEIGARDRIALCLYGLGQTSLKSGGQEAGSALPTLRQALSLFIEVGYKWAAASCFVALTGVMLQDGRARAGAVLLGAADALFESAGLGLDAFEQEDHSRYTAEAVSALGQKEFDEARAEGRAMKPEEAAQLAQPGVGGRGSGVGDRSLLTTPDRPPLTLIPPTPGMPSVLSPQSSSDLSGRELEVLRLLAAGKSNPQIASELYLSTNTVQAHLRSIYSKLGVSSRTEATWQALARKLV